jgi:thymidylate synthase ThyX
MIAHFGRLHPKQAGDSDFVWRQAVKAKAFDALRGLLPAAAQSNVGIYGTGQAYEALLLRMRAHPLPEARQYADLMLTELRKVIPSFLSRVDRPNRGSAWTAYLEKTRTQMADLTQALFAGETPAPAAAVTLVDWDPGAEDKLIAAMLWPHTALPESQVVDRVRRLSNDEKLAVIRAYAGERTNRRHKPGRALERVVYRFDVLADYGAFRDLQRHRMLTVEWQDLTPRHGADVPPAVVDAGGGDRFAASLARSSALYDALAERLPGQAAYAVALAFKVRFNMTVNAREAMHMLELRTGPQGHPAYRRVCQDMHRLIGDVAGHRAVAEMMRFVDHEDHDAAGLERLGAERRTESNRASLAP